MKRRLVWCVLLIHYATTSADRNGASSVVDTNIAETSANTNGVERFADTSDVTQLQQEVQTLRTRLQSQEQKFSALISDILAKLVTVNNDLNHMKVDIVQLKEHYQQSTNATGSFSAGLQALDARVTLNENRMNRLQLNCTDYETDIENTLNTSRAEIRNMTSRMDDIEAHVQDNAGHISHLDTQITSTSITLKSGNSSTSIAFDVEAFHDGTSPQDQPLILTSIHCNTGNGYDNATGIFTAPVNGVYLFWMKVGFTAVGGRHSSIYVKTPTSVYKAFAITGVRGTAGRKRILGQTAKRFVAERNVVTHLKEDDQVWLAASNSIKALSPGSSFGGVLINAH